MKVLGSEKGRFQLPFLCKSRVFQWEHTHHIYTIYPLAPVVSVVPFENNLHCMSRVYVDNVHILGYKDQL